MDSSTWHRGSSKSRRGGVLVTLMVIAPLVWLTMLEVAYVLAYPACADATNSWIHKPNVAFTVVSIGCALLGVWLHNRSMRAGKPIAFLSSLAMWIAALTLLVVLAMLIPPLILHPCD